MTRYEIRDIDQSAEIAAFKAELARCRELSELRLQSEQKLIAERDKLKAELDATRHLEKDLEDAMAERDLAIEQRNMGAEIIEGNCKIIDTLKAERDSYRVRQESYYALEKRVIELLTERDHLRAALEEIVQIADGPVRPLIGLNIATIARRALEGK